MHRPPTIPAAGRHGGDGPAIATALGFDSDRMLDLSQTLNPFAPNITAIAAKHLDSLSVYPDPRAATRLLAEAMGIDPLRLLLTNGGSEAIGLVTAVVGGTVHSEPEFSLHPRTPAVADPSVDAGNGRAATAIWRSDPHSPSGRLADEHDDATVWDEAFFAMATGRWTAGRSATVVGSLTKTFACPGLRIGYVIDDDVQRFAVHQPAWSVGSLALAVLPDLLARADLEVWAGQIAEARRATAAVFTERGYSVDQADAPWVLVDGPQLRELLAPHGVLVRDCSSFGLPGIARVAVTDESGRQRLATALDSAALDSAALDSAEPVEDLDPGTDA